MPLDIILLILAIILLVIHGFRLGDSLKWNLTSLAFACVVGAVLVWHY